jgi:hypothetical protein
MTTFTTEDRIISEAIPEPTWEERWGKEWVDAVRKGWNIQKDIVWFWPLTEQLGLDLDYGPTHLHHRAKGVAGVSSMPIQGSIYEFTTVPSTWSTNISPTLSVQPQNSVGQLNIGGIQIGMEKQPTWYQKVLYKLLGFNWRKK